MLVRALSGGGGGGALEYANYYADYSSANSATIPSDYDAVLVVSSYNTNPDGVRPQYNGVTYEWMKGNKSSSLAFGISAIIPNVKANTNITFNSGLSFSVYGYNYA